MNTDFTCTAMMFKGIAMAFEFVREKIQLILR